MGEVGEVRWKTFTLLYAKFNRENTITINFIRIGRVL